MDNSVTRVRCGNVCSDLSFIKTKCERLQNTALANQENSQFNIDELGRGWCRGAFWTQTKLENSRIPVSPMYGVLTAEPFRLVPVIKGPEAKLTVL